MVQSAPRAAENMQNFLSAPVPFCFEQVKRQLDGDISVCIILFRNKLVYADILPVNIFFQNLSVDRIKIADEMCHGDSRPVGKG